MENEIADRRATFVATRSARWLLAVICFPGLTGCYVLQATRGQLDVMARRQPIATVLADAETPPALRERLTEIERVRDFATTALLLPDNGSYRQYADLGRRYVVWNVFATPTYSVEPRRWCFPVAGCVVYRGYFSERGAERFAAGLRRRGNDVAIGGVAAYSTLGHFADPVLNTMLNWSDAQIAGTLFHELAHQLVYVQGDSAFNEAFASVVEEEGVRRWLKSTSRPQELASWQLQRERAETFSLLLLAARTRLKDLYGSGLPRAEMYYRKHRILGELKHAYEVQRAEWGGFAGYDGWFARTLGNADLVAIATYRRCVPGFRRLLQTEQGDLERFYAEVRALAREPAAARNRRLCGD